MALDRTTKGVLLGFAAFGVFSFSDACVKLIGGQLPPYESAFFGAVFGLTILPFLLRKGDRWIDIVSTTNLPLWLVRFLAFPVSSRPALMSPRRGLQNRSRPSKAERDVASKMWIDI